MEYKKTTRYLESKWASKKGDNPPAFKFTINDNYIRFMTS